VKKNMQPEREAPVESAASELAKLTCSNQEVNQRKHAGSGRVVSPKQKQRK
jgi:hypothetical protein